ncbi:hypothetical protein HKD37_18G051239 [Glycine soja]
MAFLGETSTQIIANSILAFIFPNGSIIHNEPGVYFRSPTPIPITPDGILNLLQSIITASHDAMLYYNGKWNIPRQDEFLGYSFTGTNPIKFDIPSGCSIETLKDVIKQVAPIGVPPYGIHESQVVRCLFFEQSGHAKYLEKLIEYEITELKNDEDVLKVLTKSNY